MSTTDPRLIPIVLEALGAECRFAVLHNEAVAAEGASESDIDVVLDESVAAVIPRLVARLARENIKVLVIWNYDVGAWTTFWTRDSFIGGLQLDLWHDPQGLGRYGVRTDRLLASSASGNKYRRLAESAELAYLLQKRLLKSNWSELSRLLLKWRSDPQRIEGYWAPRAQLDPGQIESAIEAHAPSRLLRPRRLATPAQARRVARRVLHRTGVLIEVPKTQASAVSVEAEALGDFLSLKPQCVDDVSGWRIWWLLRRPTILIRTGKRGGLRADAALSGAMLNGQESVSLASACHEALISRY